MLVFLLALASSQLANYLVIEIKRIAKDEMPEVHQEDEWDAPCIDSFQNISCTNPFYWVKPYSH